VVVIAAGAVTILDRHASCSSHHVS
jgi:hypothetical protein